MTPKLTNDSLEPSGVTTGSPGPTEPIEVKFDAAPGEQKPTEKDLETGKSWRYRQWPHWPSPASAKPRTPRWSHRIMRGIPCIP